jgi:serine protease SohB
VGMVVHCARPGVDQAVIVLTSPGGAVSSYGLAASQLIRLRKAGIKLVACVDTVAASGGYMMAAVADVIYAAPFSVIGSIGVVTQIPNVQRFLNKHDIDAYLFTAGKHKRTIDIIGDVTDEGKAKLQEELDEIHRAFKDHIALARPKVRETIEDVATGEYWLAVHAKEKGLVDDILTSDEYLESIAKENEIIELVEKKKKSSVLSGLLGPGGSAAQVLKDFLVNSFGAAAAASTTTIGPPTTPMAIA